MVRAIRKAFELDLFNCSLLISWFSFQDTPCPLYALNTLGHLKLPEDWMNTFNLHMQGCAMKVCLIFFP